MEIIIWINLIQAKQKKNHDEKFHCAKDNLDAYSQISQKHLTK